jgi:hypothetical protein
MSLVDIQVEGHQVSLEEETIREIIEAKGPNGEWDIYHLDKVILQYQNAQTETEREQFLYEIKTRTDNVIRTQSGSPTGSIESAVHSAVEQVLRVIDGNGDDRPGYNLIPREYVGQPEPQYDIAGALSDAYFTMINT